MAVEPQENQAWIASLRLLSASSKSRRELGRKLSEKGYDETVVSRVLDRLEAAGYLNDLQFALHLLVRYREHKPTGKKGIAFELKRKGIPEALCRKVLETVTDEQESESALNLAREKWGKLDRIPLMLRKKRVADFLLRRGFEYSMVREALERLAGDSNDDL